jgi:hypothetical protein
MDMHLSLSPWQIRSVDAAPEKLWRVLEVKELLPDAAFQLVNVRRRGVGERLLGLGPNLLVGIELWCVSGEVVQMEAPTATQMQTHGFVSVDFGAVPQEHDFSPEVARQQAEELDDPLPDQLGELADRLDSADAREKATLEDEFVAGFYGKPLKRANAKNTKV